MRRIITVQLSVWGAVQTWWRLRHLTYCTPAGGWWEWVRWDRRVGTWEPLQGNDTVITV